MIKENAERMLDSGKIDPDSDAYAMLLKDVGVMMPEVDPITLSFNFTKEEFDQWVAAENAASSSIAGVGNMFATLPAPRPIHR